MKTLVLALLSVVFLLSCDGVDDSSDVPEGSDVLVQDDAQVQPGPATIVDELTGLMWQGRPDEDWILWADAKDRCDNLELEGYTDWRLPTITELRTLIRGCPGTVTGGACQVIDACGDACYSPDCDGCGVYQGPGAEGCYMDAIWGDSCAYHWSSSTYVGGSVFSPVTLAWYVQFDIGWVWSGNVADNHMIARCVR